MRKLDTLAVRCSQISAEVRPASAILADVEGHG